ncbi:MAG: DsbA family protein [Cocleimonas sp.]
MILYYIHDPMCSWCWGFQPTWLKIREALENEIEIKYLLGGLAPDSDIPMPESMQKDIAGYWRKIQQHIPNTQFNFDFWENCQPRRSTYPACRAVIAARKQNTEVELAMIDSIQKAYYLKAQNPSDDSTLISLAESLGLDSQTFSDDLNAAETQNKLESEMTFARKIGAQGFPSMVLEKKSHYQTIPLDYNNASTTIQFLKDF